MKRALFILLVMLPLMGIAKKKVAKPDVSISWLRVENMEKPMGIDTDKPRFSWIILSDKQNVKQTAYQIIVSTDKGEVWNSGRVESDQQLWVPYGGKKTKKCHTMLLEGKSMDYCRRDCMERRRVLRHRTVEREPLDRSLDRTGASDA